MNWLAGTAGKRALILLAAIWAAACSSDKKTLLLVDVSLGLEVPAPGSVSLTVTKGTVRIGVTDFAWPAQGAILHAGVYLPDSAVGTVSITATGVAGGAQEIASAPDVPIVAGQTNGPVNMTLETSVVVPDGGPPAGADALPDLEISDANAVGLDGGNIDGPAVDGGGVDTVPVALDSGAADGNSPDSVLPGADGGVTVDAGVLDAPLPAFDGPGVDSPGDAASAQADATPDAAPALAWQPATNVENDILSRSYDPVVAVEPLAENVFVAWSEETAVKVQRFDRQSGTWDASKTIENRGSPDGVGIGTDAAGHIIATWYQGSSVSDPSLPGVWVSHSSDGKAWSPPQQIAPGTVVNDWDGTRELHLAVARNGVARLAYSLSVDTADTTGLVGLFTAYFDGTSWKANPDPVVAPTSPNSTRYYAPNSQLVIGGTGDGVLVLDEAEPSDAGTGLAVGVVNLIGATRTAPQIIGSDPSTGIGYRSAAMNASSDAVVVWWDMGALWASTYKTSGTWSSPQKIKDNKEFLLVTAALDNNGFVTVAWSQAIATGAYNLMALHGKVGGIWSDITPLETDNVASDSIDEMAEPKLAVDAVGNVLVVWAKKINDATWGTYARRLQGAAWQPQVKLGQKANLQTWTPVVAVADSGFGAAAFEYYDMTGNTTDTEAYNVEVAFCQ